MNRFILTFGITLVILILYRGQRTSVFNKYRAYESRTIHGLNNRLYLVGKVPDLFSKNKPRRILNLIESAEHLVTKTYDLELRKKLISEFKLETQGHENNVKIIHRYLGDVIYGDAHLNLYQIASNLHIDRDSIELSMRLFNEFRDSSLTYKIGGREINYNEFKSSNYTSSPSVIVKKSSTGEFNRFSYE